MHTCIGGCSWVGCIVYHAERARERESNRAREIVRFVGNCAWEYCIRYLSSLSLTHTQTSSFPPITPFLQCRCLHSSLLLFCLPPSLPSSSLHLRALPPRLHNLLCLCVRACVCVCVRVFVFVCFHVCVFDCAC